MFLRAGIADNLQHGICLIGRTASHEPQRTVQIQMRQRARINSVSYTHLDVYKRQSMNGNPIQSVIRVFQSPPFRDIRLSAEGSALSSRLASRARIQYGTPMTMEDIPPLRSAPEAIVR